MLRIYGVGGKLYKMLKAAQSKYEGEKATVRVNGTVSEFSSKGGIKARVCYVPMVNYYLIGVLQEVKVWTRGAALNSVC